MEEAHADLALVRQALGAEQHGLASNVVEHLLETYGSISESILRYLERDRQLAESVDAGLPSTKAEIPFAIQHEMALTLCDLMIRRMHFIHEAPDQGLGAMYEIADIARKHLGWGEAELMDQIAAYQAEVALTRKYQEEIA